MLLSWLSRARLDAQHDAWSIFTRSRAKCSRTTFAIRMNDRTQIYSAEWHTLGIVSAEMMAEDAIELARGDDPHPEHYRWRRFVKFIHGLSALDPNLARSLYELGERDPDHALGESMISVIIRHDSCPSELLEKAMRSASAHLKRVAAARLARTGA